LGQIENIFSISALTPSVKTLGPISTFAPIGMLDLSWTLALTSVAIVSVKLCRCKNKYIYIVLYGPIKQFKCIHDFTWLCKTMYIYNNAKNVIFS
jgi:hypothetical protein